MEIRKDLHERSEGTRVKTKTQEKGTVSPFLKVFGSRLYEHIYTSFFEIPAIVALVGFFFFRTTYSLHMVF